MEKDLDQQVKETKHSRYISIVINLTVIYSLLSLQYGIYPGLSSVFEFIALSYSVILTAANALTVLAILAILIYLVGLDKISESLTAIRDASVAFRSQGMEDFDVGNLMSEAKDFNLGDKHIETVEELSTRLSKPSFIIKNYIFTILIAFLSFQLGMMYLFVIEILSLVILEILKTLSTQLYRKILEIIDAQKEIKEIE